MTTTHTFHGLNTESRSSSRVLNPPGGSSSNIFGGCDNQLKQSCARNNPEMMSREKSDNVGHGLPEKTTGSQQKSWAPRSAFNPITGEVYEQPKTRSVTGVPSSESGASKSFPVGASQQPSGISNAVSVDKIQSELVQPAAAVVPSAAAVVQPAAAVVPSAATVVQPAEVQPVAAEVQPTAVVEIHAEEKPQASQSGRMFGESVEDTKPHRSTRVSQPPGGHSSKLW